MHGLNDEANSKGLLMLSRFFYEFLNLAKYIAMYTSFLVLSILM